MNPEALNSSVCQWGLVILAEKQNRIIVEDIGWGQSGSCKGRCAASGHLNVRIRQSISVP
eukprot:scaffold349291_cov14-Prasinocladus_malaysianus.AAC.1